MNGWQSLIKMHEEHCYTKILVCKGLHLRDYIAKKKPLTASINNSLKLTY